MSSFCLLVFLPTTNCQVLTPILITNFDTEGYIASYVTQKTGCGGTNNPWLLTVDEGQRINITLIDFASKNDKEENENDENVCIVYATIRDGQSAVRNVICGGGPKKITTVFISTSNSVEIQLVSKVNQQQKTDAQFLLKYSSRLFVNIILDYNAEISILAEKINTNALSKMKIRIEFLCKLFYQFALSNLSSQ